MIMECPPRVGRAQEHHPGGDPRAGRGRHAIIETVFADLIEHFANVLRVASSTLLGVSLPLIRLFA